MFGRSVLFKEGWRSVAEIKMSILTHKEHILPPGQCPNVVPIWCCHLVRVFEEPWKLQLESLILSQTWDQNHSWVCYSPGLVTLRACYRAPKPQNPENPKKILNPPPRVGPRNYEKNTEKNTKMTPRMAILGSFLCFFGIFFVVSGANPGWGISYFFRIFGVLRFWGSVAGPQGHNPGLF